MTEEEVEDYDSVVNCLVNMFGNVINRDAIISIVESCEGDLNLAADAVMNITNDTSQDNTQNNIILTNESIPATDQCLQNQCQNQNVTSNNSTTTQTSSNAQPSNIVNNQSIPATSQQVGGLQNQFPNQDVPLNQNVPLNSYSMAMQTSKKAKPSQKHPPNPTTKQGKRAQPYHPSTWNDQIKRIVENHNGGSRILIIMRGAPGSGKTYQAEKIVEMLVGGTYVNFKTHICSTDDFFMVRGRYQFKKQDLSQAHAWNQNRVKLAMGQGLSPIVIDNTNIELWEMEFYVRNGVENGYILEVVEPSTHWAKKAYTLAKTNKHNVPFVTIKRMLDCYVDGITGDYLLKHFNLSYPLERTPPVLRLMPVVVLTNPETQSVSNASGDSVQSSVATATSKSKDPSIQESNDNGNVGAVKNTAERSSSRPSNSLEAKDMIDSNCTANMKIAQEHVPNTDETKDGSKNPYSEVQKQLEEIQKVELDWENGESWEENRQEAASSTNNTKPVCPKPQRANKPNSDETVMSAINTCQDWSDITLFLPPWHEPQQSEVSEKVFVETRTASTCVELGDNDHNNTNFKILTGSPKNINEFHMSFEIAKIPERPKLDKSTTTDELLPTESIKRCKNAELHFIRLKRIFHYIDEAALRDVFEKCECDVNWAMEIISESLVANPHDYKNSASAIKDLDDEIVGEDLGECTCMCNYSVNPNSSAVAAPDTSKQENSKQPIKSHSIVTKKNGKRDIKMSDASMQLKREIEQNIVIADNHYSKHCLKLKQWRHGEYLTDDETIESVSDDMQQPSTNEGQSNDLIEAGGISKPSVSNEIVTYTSKPSTSQSQSNDHLVSTAKPSTSRDQTNNKIVPYNNDFDDQDDDDEGCLVSTGDFEKSVNVTLGKVFIKEIDSLFGREDMTYPDNLITKINMPMTLLNEINALWMESLMYQLDEQERQRTKMIQEDEEYARALTIKEAELAEKGKPVEVLDFKEIMDMDFALSLYQRDVKGWKSKEPTDLAAKLTREKLYNLFPDIHKEVLSELLMAHDNDFLTTVEGLIVSTGNAHILQDKDGLNNFITQKEMERQTKALEEEKKALSEEEWPLLPKGEVPDMQTVNGYRDTADRHLKNRDTNFRKASEYINKGMLGVSGYYWQLAEFHKLKYEQSNSLAAASLVQFHAANNPDNATVDLHYLRVGEARETLDLFLDSHISKLKQNGKKNITLFFITGRGLHSHGRPRVKPAVRRRLRERGLVCKEVNPGLLSARVSSDDVMTHQVA